MKMKYGTEAKDYTVTRLYSHDAIKFFVMHNHETWSTREAFKATVNDINDYSEALEKIRKEREEAEKQLAIEAENQRRFEASRKVKLEKIELKRLMELYPEIVGEKQ